MWGGRHCKKRKGEARLRWYGHVIRGDGEESDKEIMEVTKKGSKQREVGGRLKKWMACVKIRNIKRLKVDVNNRHEKVEDKIPDKSCTKVG
jgi:hypothetical protein